MDGKSRLPTMIKKPSVRTQIPTDRLAASQNTLSKTTTATGVKQIPGNRAALTSFESIMNSLRNGSTGTRPASNKRHASPEFRAPKPPPIAAKKMRRSRSVTDINSVKNIDEILNMVQRKNRDGGVLSKPIAIGKSKQPPLKGPIGGITKAKVQQKFVPKPKPVVSKPASVPNHKRVVLNSTANTKTENDTVKPTNTKPKFAPYDFKGKFHYLKEQHDALKDKHERLKQQLGEFESLPEQYDECCAKLSKLEDDYKFVQCELSTLKEQSDADQLKIKSLNDELNAKIEECRSVTEAKDRVTEQYTVATTEIKELKTNNTELKTQLDEYKEMIDKQAQELQEAADQLYRANVDRKDLHNTIMDLRGNIRVFCRIRPPLDGEENRTLCSWQYNDETSLEIASVEINKKPVKHDFSFDQVFPPNSLQVDIFELVSPLVQSALDGYNVCIFAYGQTGSGKTFTMDGVGDAPGIIPRTIDLLFDCFKQNKRLGWEFSLQASALEIYNETLFDLLSNEVKDLDIRMVSAKTPTEIFVSNLTECSVDNKEDLHKLMQIAKMNRATASTVGNERSSRSHAVTQLRIFGKHATKNEITVSTINLIDLAGSESPKTSVRMEETKKINKSLSELTNVIMALLQKQDHIPYRNSKLTHLLMPSLGGNSKTLMFVNVSPFQDCFVETVKSLRFAASVNSCKMNKAKKNKMYTSPLN